MENFNAEEARKLTSSFKIVGLLESIRQCASSGASYFGVQESLSPFTVSDLEARGFNISFPTPEMMAMDNKTVQCINW